MRRWEIWFLRVLLTLELTFAAVVLVVGPHAPSLWRSMAIGLGTSAVAFLATRTGYQLFQLIGLRPPATRDS